MRPAGCGLRLDSLPVYPVRDSRVVERQEALLALVTGTVRESEVGGGEFFAGLLVALRLAVYLGRADMLRPQADIPLWSTFSVFERVRDRIARVGNDKTYGQIAVQPGPMLKAAEMIIISELCGRWAADPIAAVRRLFDDYVGHPDDRVLWDRAPLSTYGFCEGVSELLNLRFPTQPRWRWLIHGEFYTPDVVTQVIPPEEHLVGLGEWALAVTPVTPIPLILMW